MVYILGAGAMAREVLYIYKDLGRFEEVGGFVEQNSKRAGSKIHGKTVVDASIIENLPGDTKFIGAIGSPRRREWIEELEKRGFGFDTVVHPSVVIGDSVHVGEGSIVCPGSVLTCDIRVGRHTIINIGVTINHDCVIGDFVTISPGVNVAGDVTLNDGCWIGIGATIINGAVIGRGAFIGAGAVVTEDIPDGWLAVGVPAKPVRKIKESEWNRLIGGVRRK